MAMSIDKTRDEGLAGEIDDLCLLSLELHDRLLPAEGKDPPPLDGQRFDCGGCIIDRHYVTPQVDKIGTGFGGAHRLAQTGSE